MIKINNSVGDHQPYSEICLSDSSHYHNEKCNIYQKTTTSLPQKICYLPPCRDEAEALDLSFQKSKRKDLIKIASFKESNEILIPKDELIPPHLFNPILFPAPSIITTPNPVASMQTLYNHNQHEPIDLRKQILDPNNVSLSAALEYWQELMDARMKDNNNNNQQQPSSVNIINPSVALPINLYTNFSIAEPLNLVKTRTTEFLNTLAANDVLVDSKATFLTQQPRDDELTLTNHQSLVNQPLNRTDEDDDNLKQRSSCNRFKTAIRADLLSQTNVNQYDGLLPPSDDVCDGGFTDTKTNVTEFLKFYGGGDKSFGGGPAPNVKHNYYNPAVPFPNFLQGPTSVAAPLHPLGIFPFNGNYHLFPFMGSPNVAAVGHCFPPNYQHFPAAPFFASQQLQSEQSNNTPSQPNPAYLLNMLAAITAMATSNSTNHHQNIFQILQNFMALSLYRQPPPFISSNPFNYGENVLPLNYYHHPNDHHPSTNSVPPPASCLGNVNSPPPKTSPYEGSNAGGGEDNIFNLPGCSNLPGDIMIHHDDKCRKSFTCSFANSLNQTSPKEFSSDEANNNNCTPSHDDGRSSETTVIKESSTKDLLNTDSGVDLTYEEDGCGGSGPMRGNIVQAPNKDIIQESATKFGKEAVSLWNNNHNNFTSHEEEAAESHHPNSVMENLLSSSPAESSFFENSSLGGGDLKSNDPYDMKRYLCVDNLQGDHKQPERHVYEDDDIKIKNCYRNVELTEEDKEDRYKFLYPANDEEVRAFNLDGHSDERLASLMRQQYQFYSLYGCGKDGEAQKGVHVKSAHELLMLKNQGCGRPCNKDERLALALSLPFSIEKIVTFPIDAFGEMLRKSDLSVEQIGLVRDIRRRGKNKIAAQNCRKRKLDLIMYLGQTVDNLKKFKSKLTNERATLEREKSNYLDKLNTLFKETFTLPPWMGCENGPKSNSSSSFLIENQNNLQSHPIQEYQLNTDVNGNGCLVSGYTNLPDIYFRWQPRQIDVD